MKFKNIKSLGFFLLLTCYATGYSFWGKQDPVAKANMDMDFDNDTSNHKLLYQVKPKSFFGKPEKIDPVKLEKFKESFENLSQDQKESFKRYLDEEINFWKHHSSKLGKLEDAIAVVAASFFIWWGLNIFKNRNTYSDFRDLTAISMPFFGQKLYNWEKNLRAPDIALGAMAQPNPGFPPAVFSQRLHMPVDSEGKNYLVGMFIYFICVSISSSQWLLFASEHLENLKDIKKSIEEVEKLLKEKELLVARN